jgi:stage III sporulation protein SpoIIIAA
MTQDYELDGFLAIIPDGIRQQLVDRDEFASLYEVVIDLGRPPEARYKNETVYLSDNPVTFFDIEWVIGRVREFDRDNRSGIERTLHRISAIQNRSGRIVGLTLRYGRAIQGVINVIKNFFESGKSVLIVGRPGVGKTTIMREAARVLSTEMEKRVIIVDTSNEIAGDGDIPHHGIGRARRMQVPKHVEQHTVMIQAVENHMPEVIVIDEIGTEEEAAACRTIAERGVQLVGTAHGNSITNLLMNPTLSDLLGGINSVVLSDEEAYRRGTQKTVLERTQPPTFDVLIEIRERGRFAIYPDIADAVDRYLRNSMLKPELRIQKEDGTYETQFEEFSTNKDSIEEVFLAHEPKESPKDKYQEDVVDIFPFGISRDYIERAARALRVRVGISRRLSESDMVLTTINYEQKRPQAILEAKTLEIPVYAIAQNSLSQVKRFLRGIQSNSPDEAEVQVILNNAIETVLRENQTVRLPAAPPKVRRYQHKTAERFGLVTSSIGEEPNRSVVIHPPKFQEVTDDEN